ncbi:phosphoribosyltransferase [Streptomyces sp. NRRL S-350]|uniref:phosphoribosyltransferase n=1 Tax=Streptomyces sp. NRRL S-350 TaxID=1463902 RepID=UPI000A498687|nr:phosphoribosyltransferase [Streptomyces sp. NRRL S-350]
MSMPTAIRPLTISRLARDLASRAGQPVPALHCYESLAALWTRCRDTGQPGEQVLHEATYRAARLLAAGDDTVIAPVAGRLPLWLRSDRSVVRLPASLAVQGVEWQDMLVLAQTWLDARHDTGPVLVAGVRTGGAYLAPLIAAHLKAAGVDVQVTSVRPGEHLDADNRRILLVDDPPLTGRTLLALARETPEAEVLVPVFDTADVQPLRKAGIAVTVLPREKWQSTRRLDPGALAAYLQAHAEWPGADQPLSLDAPAPGRENSALAPWPGVRRRSPARAAVQLRTPGGIRHAAVAAWVPPGIFGGSARAAATELQHPVVPVTLAVAPALVVSEDVTPTAPLGPQPGPDRLEEALDYVLARASQLPVQTAESTRPVPAGVLALAQALTGTDGTQAATVLHDLLSVLPPGLPDNRCEGEKWLLDADGRLRKTGHLAHAYRRDNELLTPLIDLAALTITFGSSLDAVADSLARRLPGEQPWHEALAVAVLCYGAARGEQLPRTYNVQRAAETAREAYRLQRGMTDAAALLQRTLNKAAAGPRAAEPVVARWTEPPAALVQPRLPFGGTPAPQAGPGPAGEELALVLKTVERWARGRFHPVREGDVLLLAPLDAPSAWPQARTVLDELPGLLPRAGLLAWCGVPVVSLGGVT